MTPFLRAASAALGMLSALPAAAATLPYDVAFLVDQSNSLTATQQQAQFDLVADLIEGQVDPTGTGNRVSLIEFSTAATTVFGLSDPEAADTALAAAAVRARPLGTGWTNTADAIQLAIDGFVAPKAARERRIVLLSDGVPCLPPTASLNACPMDLTPFVQKLAEAEAQLYFVATGSLTDTSFIDVLLADPTRDIAFIDTFSASDAERFVPLSAVPLPAGLPLILAALAGLAALGRVQSRSRPRRALPGWTASGPQIAT